MSRNCRDLARQVLIVGATVFCVALVMLGIVFYIVASGYRR
jgi:hypothetical protein